VLPAGSKIKAHGYFLIANERYVGPVTPDATSPINMSASTTGGGNLRIGTSDVTTADNDPNVVDRIAYGTGNSPEGGATAPAHPAPGGSLERKALAGSTSSSMAAGGTDAAKGNGYDSQDNSADFVTRAVRDPQNSSSAVELP
jgi:hypothetical protein